MMKSLLSRALKMAALAACTTLPLTGCVSVYSNTARFNREPNVGMSELDLIQQYGAPDFSGFVDDQKVYVYKIRDSKFIVLLGQYSGHDLVVLTKGGVVKDARRLPRGQGITLFYAAPWMGHD